MGGRRRRRLHRLVLCPHRSVQLPGRRLHVRRRFHDRRAPDPRLADARRPQPPLARAAREGGRAATRASWRTRAASARVPRTTPGRPPGGPCTEFAADSCRELRPAPDARRRGGAHAPRPRDARAHRRRRAAARAAGAEDGALLLPRRDEHACLRDGVRGARGARAPAGGGRGVCRPRGARRRGDRRSSVLAAGGAGRRPGGAVSRDARRAAEGSSAAGVRRARPRRHGELRALPGDAGGGPAVAAGRARPLRQLAVPAARPTRRALGSRRPVARAAARRAAAAPA